jgi:hypothetical protein
MITRIKIISVLLIMLTLISPPFVFSQLQFFGREIRGLIGLAVIILLFFENTKFKASELLLLSFLVFVIVIELLLDRSDYNNILSAYAVIFIAFLLFKALKDNKFSSKIFLQIWMRFSLIISIFAIISFFLNQFTNLSDNFTSLNLTNSVFNPIYDYKNSIFGFTVLKEFAFGDIERVASYFYEPSYAGLFFAFNILIIPKNSKLFTKKYYIFSVLAGLLTFSVTFYLAFIIYLILSLEVRKLRIMFFLTLLILSLLLILYLSNVNFYFLDLTLSQTSFKDRMERNLIGLDVLKDASFFKILFGHGINTFQEINPDIRGRNLSSGFLYLFFESGILISFFILSMFKSISNKNYTLLIVGLFYLMAIPWYKYYYCWYAVILCGLANLDTISYKKPFGKSNLKNYKITKGSLN